MRLLTLQLAVQCGTCHEPLTLTWPMADNPHDPRHSSVFVIDASSQQCVRCGAWFQVRIYGEVAEPGQRWQLLGKTKGEAAL